MAAEHGHGDGVPPCGQPELGEARFWAAVEEGNADALQGLLREGAAVDQPTPLPLRQPASHCQWNCATGKLVPPPQLLPP